MRWRTVLVVPACWVLLAALAPQSRPDFSGSWTRDETKTTTSPASGGSQRGASMPVGTTIIQQTPASLNIERRGSLGSIVYTYKLDGTDAVNKNGAMTMTTRSRWEGRRLLTEGSEEQSTSQGYASWAFKEVRSLDPHGALIVDTTRTQKDAAASTQHEVFVKK